jgi:hypothetical protein
MRKSGNCEQRVCGFFGLCTSTLIFQSEANTRLMWKLFRALIAILLVTDRQPRLFRSALTIERICWSHA